MTQYNLIQNGESGLAVRTTLNEVITSANSGFTSVYYQIDTNTLPLSGKSGDVLLITNDGTSSGTVSQELIYDGSQWKDVLSVDTGSTISNNISYTTFIPIEGTYQQMSSVSGLTGTRVNSIYIDPITKKIAVAGQFTGYNDVSTPNILLLNSGGTKNAQFTPQNGAFNGSTSEVKIKDSFIYVGVGPSTTYSGTSVKNLVKLAETGATLDTSFNTNLPNITFTVSEIEFQSDGKIVYGGSGTGVKIGRVNADGTPDATFNVGTGFNNSVSAIIIQPDQKILVGGNFTEYNGVSKSRICRLNSDGSIDNTFLMGSGVNLIVNGLTLQSDGKILVATSSATLYNGSSVTGLFRLNSDGTLDTTFTKPISNGSFYDVQVDKNDRIYCGINTLTVASGDIRTGIVRYNKNGQIDLTYRNGFNDLISGQVFSVGVGDQYVIAGGTFTQVDYQPISQLLARLNHDNLPLGSSGDKVISTKTGSIGSIVGREWTYDSTQGWVQTSSEVLAERYSGPVRWQDGFTGKTTDYLSAITTAPNLGTAVYKNSYFVRKTGEKEIEVNLQLAWSPVSTNAGSGDYLITLPSGLQFDLTNSFEIQEAFNSLNGTASLSFLRYALTTGTGNAFYGSTFIQYQVQPVIYDSTRFRILMNGAAIRCWGSSWVGVANDPTVINMTFRAQVL